MSPRPTWGPTASRPSQSREVDKSAAWRSCVPRFFRWTDAAEPKLDGSDCCMGPRHHPQFPVDPVEAVSNGGGADLKLSANLPIGVTPDKQLQDLDLALREPNLVTGPPRRGLVWRRGGLFDTVPMGRILCYADRAGDSVPARGADPHRHSDGRPAGPDASRSSPRASIHRRARHQAWPVGDHA